MKIKQTVMTFAVVVGIASGMIISAQSAYANHTPNHADNQDAQVTTNPAACPETKSSSGDKCCGGAQTSIISCTQGAGTDAKNNGVMALLVITLKILTAGVGIVAVGGIAYGAALYASSADKPDQAKAGITYIKNVVLGLIAFGLMYIVLNFLIPGGIF